MLLCRTIQSSTSYCVRIRLLYDRRTQNLDNVYTPFGGPEVTLRWKLH